jgi:hypothetical protein
MRMFRRWSFFRVASAVAWSALRLGMMVLRKISISEVQLVFIDIPVVDFVVGHVCNLCTHDHER